MVPTGTTAAREFRAAVIGSPIAHSKSPLLHGAVYRALGIDCSYSAIDVDEAQVGAFLDDLRAGTAWRGLSVTMPLKGAVARLVDSTTAPADVLGVVNTVVVGVGPHPTLTGHNTDVAGVAHALAASGVGTPQRAAVLGGGGTAAAAVAGLAQLGAGAVSVIVRRPAAAADLQRIGGALGVEIALVPWSHAAEVVPASDVVVSTLPPRAADPLARELAAHAGFRTDGTLLDVAYDPWPSRLAAAWQQAGGRIVPGLDMLIHQAVEQVALFFPEAGADRAVVLRVMYDAVGAVRR
ncbi:shikimate dehydrogenase [Arthrobacter sp. L77]|uniref:shikimate dehydrogenase n=1 Tax=Arthrobacter sp. L77 TaxID=1496689 RepID=UPI000A5BE863|nr:shikimate dehydrogenase [Arthrobacter sp. L77]